MTSVKEYLEAIRLKNGGLLSEEAILAEAKSKKHPLHSRFTWNDTEAARQWRLEEARLLIRSVYVTVETRQHEAVSVRAYASLPSDREAQGGYRSIMDIMSNKRQREELFNAALSELNAFKQRYGNLSRLAPVFTAIEQVKSSKTQKRPVARSKTVKSRAAHV